MHAALRRQGVCASRKRVARLMAQASLVDRCRRKKTRTTFSEPEARALDLVKRAFGPGTELDQTWVSVRRGQSHHFGYAAGSEASPV